jgi:hypothetical protein
MLSSLNKSNVERMEYETNKEVVLFGIDSEELVIPEVKITFHADEKMTFKPIRYADDAADIFRELYPDGTIEMQEQMLVLFLDQQNKVKGYYRHSQGAINATVADIRIILAGALKSLSVSMIIAHNHPSGNLMPSEADKLLTKKFRIASQMMDVALLDHMIITKASFYSFADNGFEGLVGVDFANEEKHPKASNENQHTLNQRIESFIAGKEHRKEAYSEEDIDFIQQYEGSGGQGKNGASGEGVLYEFYTPDYLVKLMWELAYRHGYKEGTVLEPSIATGRLIKYAPDPSKCVGFEINPISARIAKIIYPKATIYNDYFETAFLEYPRFTKRIKDDITWLKAYPFSLVIGNPPFGIYKNKYSSYFTKPGFRQIEIFFMYYGLQLLKKGGLMIYVTGSNFLRNGDTYNESKKELEKICDLVDAYRLPPIFKSSDVPVDVIVFKKK